MRSTTPASDWCARRTARSTKGSGTPSTVSGRRSSSKLTAAGRIAHGLVQRPQPRRGARHPRRRPLPDGRGRVHDRIAPGRRSRVRGRLRRAVRRARRPLRQRRGHRHARPAAVSPALPARGPAAADHARRPHHQLRRPCWPTSSGTSSAASATLQDVVQALQAGAMRRAPDFLLDHMPRGYTTDIWNDHDAHG